jgi:type IV pilus assembly protein PilA
MSRSRARERGQGLTEYALIVVLVAVAALVALKLFGRQIKGLFTSATTEIATTTGTRAP